MTYLEEREVLDQEKIDIESLVERASDVLPLSFPLSSYIASNPIRDLEKMPFEEAVEKASSALQIDGTSVDNKVNRLLIKWLSLFFDKEQASILMPGKERGFYQAWRELAPFDKELTISAQIPKDPNDAISFAMQFWDLPISSYEPIMRRELCQLPGWAGFIKWQKNWSNQPVSDPITLVDLLAVRLLMHIYLGTKPSWESGKVEKVDLSSIKRREENYKEFLLPSLLQKNMRREKKRSKAQFIFCIDVRSEPIRRKLEEEEIETFGFAGFFGLPISWKRREEKKFVASCPVLLQPAHHFEQIPPSSKIEEKLEKMKNRRSTIHNLYQGLKYNFGTAFALVETVGFWSGLWMGSSLLLPKLFSKSTRKIKEACGPDSQFHCDTFTLEEKVQYAEGALCMMGLTDNFSPIIICCGHGSSTENNPYASSLHCGACGGNRGGFNAKLFATTLNDPKVRCKLAEKNILIPEDTLFIAAEHDTTTDEIHFLESSSTKEGEKKIEELQKICKRAAEKNVKERSPSMGVKPQRIIEKSCHWAEVRPEWGLAKNGSFIVAPRSLTQNINLQGRSFLHSYDWEKDDGTYLEKIMTAPMVVAQWINAQYFFSTLDNRLFGAGNKVTQNIVGKIGVMQGNASDLMHGLPLQSVYSTDDEPYHEPIRLFSIIYAPKERVEKIIQKHSSLKLLVKNKWIHLFVIDPLTGEYYDFIA